MGRLIHARKKRVLHSVLSKSQIYKYPLQEIVVFSQRLFWNHFVFLVCSCSIYGLLSFNKSHQLKLARILLIINLRYVNNSSLYAGRNKSKMKNGNFKTLWEKINDKEKNKTFYIVYLYHSSYF